MKLGDSRGIQTGQWYPNEILRDTDINAVGKGTYKNLTDQLAAQHTDLINSGKDFVVGGLELEWSTLLTTTLRAGIAVSSQGYYLIGDTWGFAADAGSSFMVAVPVDQSVGFDAGDGSNDRIDIVEIRPVEIDYDSSSRNFKDPVTSLVTTAVIDTKKEYGYEFAVRKGTPAGSPVAPTATSGWVKIAEVYVAQSATAIDQDDIKDVRRNWGWTTGARDTVSIPLPPGTFRGVTGRSVSQYEPVGWGDRGDHITNSPLLYPHTGGISFRDDLAIAKGGAFVMTVTQLNADGTLFFLAYESGTGAVTGRTVSVSDAGVMTANATASLSGLTGNISQMSSQYLEENKVIVYVADTPGSNAHTCVIATVSGTTVTWGSGVRVPNGHTNGNVWVNSKHNMAVMSPTRIAVLYQTADNNIAIVEANVGAGVGNTTITYRTELALSTDARDASSSVVSCHFHNRTVGTGGAEDVVVTYPQTTAANAVMQIVDMAASTPVARTAQEIYAPSTVLHTAIAAYGENDLWVMYDDGNTAASNVFMRFCQPNNDGLSFIIGPEIQLNFSDLFPEVNGLIAYMVQGDMLRYRGCNASQVEELQWINAPDLAGLSAVGVTAGTNDPLQAKVAPPITVRRTIGRDSSNSGSRAELKPIGGGRWVRVLDDGSSNAAIHLYDVLPRVAGIALSAVTSGEFVLVQYEGTLEGQTGLTPGVAYYVGSDGELSRSPGAGLFLGLALDSSRIQLNLSGARI